MIHDSYCPYRYYEQVFNGKDIDTGMAWCNQDEYPCQQEEGGRCRITVEIEAYISNEENLEEVKDAD